MKQIPALFAAVAALSFVAAPASAQTFGELMEDIGIKKREQTHIDFSERAPLVVPPALNALPPPEDHSELVRGNPNWPNDPRVQKQQFEEEMKRQERLDERKYADRSSMEIYRIRQREREEGIMYDAARANNYDPEKDTRRLSPQELKEVQRRRNAEAAAAVPQGFTEPERVRLTDPPPGYRTPSGAQPYGPGEKEKKSIFSRMNPFN